MENKYSRVQIDDIKGREKEGLEQLKKLRLTPACQIVKENIGADVFADKLYPYLADTKFVLEGDKFVESTIPSPYVANKKN